MILPYCLTNLPFAFLQQPCTRASIQGLFCCNTSQTYFLNHSLPYHPTKREMLTTAWTRTAFSFLCGFYFKCAPFLSSCLSDPCSEVPLKCPYILCNSILNHSWARRLPTSSAYVTTVSSPHTALYCSNAIKKIAISMETSVLPFITP